ncbi:MAG: PSD1 domain-containing protein, partial [Planctomycetes bacterium]|nr:PSD1 domain-containing protein [Planctomycetota bacterium]
MIRLGLLAVVLFTAGPGWGEEVDFARQIRPILSKNCFSCHGHDAKHREAELRLDTRDGAIAKRDGAAAVVPGSSSKSALHARITSDDPDERMPPADSGRELTEEEIDLLRRWIDQGAEYSAHWAFIKPVQTTLPKINDKSWPKNTLDYFVLARLEAKGLRPSVEADRYTLIRRLSFDLTGLPPTPEQVKQFIDDNSPQAYEKLVDRLLDSRHYGERWARVWMDLARYADTQGYEKDARRNVWPWRDWLIKALNDDMPYDQFTIEQLAGDLLPDANSQQVLATVFHRNTMTNTEGGTDDEEFRVAAVKDRVDTTGLIWLGLSVGCAKCHSHKYDPISQTEYYQLFAFFNQSADADRNDDAPKRALPSAFHYQQHKELVQQLAAARKKLKKNPSADTEATAKQIAELERQLEQKVMAMKPPAVPVMQELPEQKRRRTRLLIKGDFLNPGSEVKAGVPESLHAMSDHGAMNRLSLARWLMDKENPLAARVAVNRIWSRMFGAGLVETEEDFGTQGELPSHPRLLDWLAIEFRDTHHWSRKKLCKTIVMSATYRQFSKVTRELRELDLHPDIILLEFVARHIRPELMAAQLLKDAPKADTPKSRRLELLTAENNIEPVDRLLAAVRSKILRERYRFDLDWMLDLMVNQYGPLDWRNAFAHSLYWSSWGDHYTEGQIGGSRADAMNTARFVFFSLQNLTTRGKMTLWPDFDDPFSSYLELTPDTRYIPYIYETYLRLGKKHFGDDPRFVEGTAGPNYAKGMVTNAHNWIELLYLEGGEENLEQAENYLAWLRKTNPHPDGSTQERYLVTLDEFVMGDLLAQLQTFRAAKGIIGSFIRKSLKQFALGLTEQGRASFGHAVQSYEYWMEDTKIDFNDRRKLQPPLLQLRDQIESFMQVPQYATLAKARLWNNLPLQQ